MEFEGDCLFVFEVKGQGETSVQGEEDGMNAERAMNLEKAQKNAGNVYFSCLIIISITAERYKKCAASCRSNMDLLLFHSHRQTSK